MKTIEQFRTEQAQALARHEAMMKRAESFAAAGFPVPEYIADSRTHGAIHISYRNDSKNPRSMAQAVELFAHFAKGGAVLAMHVLKDGTFTTCHPESRMPAKKGNATQYKRDAYKNSAYAVSLNVRHMHESRYTNAEIDFFAIVGEEFYSISVQFGRGYIGTCLGLAPKMNEARGYANRIESRSFTPNANAHALTDACMTFSYGGDIGPIKTGADHRFLIVADHDEETPIECSHALGQLENLAGIVDGDKA